MDVIYGLTCTMLLLAAVTVLRESDKMPGRYLPTIHLWCTVGCFEMIVTVPTYIIFI
jgi:hypothetical protein